MLGRARILKRRASARFVPRRGLRGVVAGTAIAAIATSFTGGHLHAFDKQTCAVAYENAQQLRSKLKLRRARDQLLICGHSSCPSVVTKDCNSWLDELEAELTSVIFHARDSRGQELTEVRVTMDGEHLRDRIDTMPVFVDPGMHVFKLEGEGMIGEVRQMVRKGDRDRSIEVAMRARLDDLPPKLDAVSEIERGDAGISGGRLTDARAYELLSETRPPIEIQLGPPATSRPPPGTGSYVAAGIGAVALTSFAYFGLSATSDAATLRSECAPSCPSERVDAVRSKLVVANVSLGVGVVSLGVAGLLWLLQSPSAPKAASALRIDVVPPLHGSGAQVVTTFSAP